MFEKRMVEMREEEEEKERGVEGKGTALHTVMVGDGYPWEASQNSRKLSLSLTAMLSEIKVMIGGATEEEEEDSALKLKASHCQLSLTSKSDIWGVDDSTQGAVQEATPVLPSHDICDEQATAEQRNMDYSDKLLHSMSCPAGRQCSMVYTSSLFCRFSHHGPVELPYVRSGGGCSTTAVGCHA